MESVHNHFIPHAIVNGLIATIVLWSFWMPFIIFVAVPIVNALLKDAVCGGLRGLTGLPVQQVYQPAVNNLLNDEGELAEINKPLKYTFIFSYFIVVAICLYISSSLISAYGMNSWEITKFNIVMAIIIVIIEMSFFIGVSIQYVPFNPSVILGSLSSQINSYYNSVISKQ